MNIYATSYPVLDGEPVTQGHTNYCRDNGHATHTVDGKTYPVCPRCGEFRTVQTLVPTENDDVFHVIWESRKTYTHVARDGSLMDVECHEYFGQFNYTISITEIDISHKGQLTNIERMTDEEKARAELNNW